MNVADFVNQFLPGALDLEKQKGLPSLFVVAQWANESGYNSTTLASVYHNLGGVKYDPWMDPYGAKPVKMLTWEYTPDNEEYADFAAFPDYQSYIRMYGDLMTGWRYKPCLKFKDDVKAYAQAVKDAGYATDLNYVTAVMNRVTEIKPAYDAYLAEHPAPAPEPPKPEMAFADIPAGYWALEDWQKAIKYGLVNGYPAGTYHPEDRPTRSEMVAFGVRVAEYTFRRIKEALENGD